MIGDLIKKGLRKRHPILYSSYRKMEFLLLQYQYTTSLFFLLLQYRYRKKFGIRTFEFRGHAYNYFCHRYSATWRNERVVEIPIVWEIVKSCRGRVLEVGNVLSHYYPITHDIVDKYEQAKGVINQDIVNFQPSERYDLIISISTIEHVGWEEKPREPRKILRALENLKLNCLASGGKIVITLPLGYNSELDKLLNEGKINLGKQYYLKRISKDNEWVETGWNDIRNVKYNVPFPDANGIVVSVFEK